VGRGPASALNRSAKRKKINVRAEFARGDADTGRRGRSEPGAHDGSGNDRGNSNVNGGAEMRAGLNGEARPYNDNSESQKRRLAACATGRSAICTGSLNFTGVDALTLTLRAVRLLLRLENSNS
jgi:hypothetical protein